MASLVSSPFTLSNSKVDQLSSLAKRHLFLHSFLPKKANYNGSSNSKASLKVKCIGNGLFTQTTQEVRRIVPENSQNLPTVKIVYVVLEAQYQSSLSAAVRGLNSKMKDASFEVVGYLVEELRDESNYKAFCKDLEDANIFIGSLIFVEELAPKFLVNIVLLSTFGVSVYVHDKNLAWNEIIEQCELRGCIEICYVIPISSIS